MLTITNDDGIQLIRMCRGKVNALDLEFCQALVDAIRSAEADEAVRAVVLIGNGRVFSAGIDLKRWLAEGVDYVEPFMESLESVFCTLFMTIKPVVAAIDGPAIAGGCMIACAADYRLIAQGARIGIPEMRIGVPLPMSAIEIMRFVSPNGAFQRIATLGSTVSDGAALEHGLADDLVDREEILAVAVREAANLATIPPAAYRLTKWQIRQPVMRQIEANRQRLGLEFYQIWKSAETRQAVDRYVRERLS